MQANLQSRLTRRRFLAQSSLMAAAGTATPFIAQNEVQAQKAGNAPVETPPPVTHTLADWVVRCRLGEIPAAPRKEALRSIVNWIGVTAGGSTQDAVSIALQTLVPFTCASGASLFGRTEKLDPLRAALVSGISSHVLDFDDTDLRTIIHPAGPVAAALFALCQMRQMSGAEFLHAFILGVEVECRLGRAIYPSHYDMGWHITGTCGAFGSAAACGKALGLDTGQMEMALGIAATETAGLKVEFGSMSKSLNIGRAAENGLLAALLAAKGFSSSAQAIEAKDGYVLATSTHHDYDAITRGLGEHFEISHNTYKPFACGIVMHPAIDAALQLRKQYHLAPSDLRSITVRANPLVLQLTGKTDLRGGLDSKFSIYHAVAAAFVRGYAGPDEFSDEAANDPVIQSLRQRVKVTVDPSVRTDEAFLTLLTIDGRTIEKHVDHAVGSLERPLTDSDLEDKYTALTKNVLSATQCARLLKLAWSLEERPDAAELPRMAAKQVSDNHREGQ